MPDILNRYLGGMMGVAAGDALGGTTELCGMMRFSESTECFGILSEEASWGLIPAK
ncbi:MAG: hypothetical protein WB502_02975 [Thermoactinomyces sp.]